MDIFVLNGVVKELNDSLAGERLEKIGQPDPLSVSLTFGRKKRRNLLISAAPALPRMHLVEAPPPNLLEPPSFCRTLRKHLGGVRLERVEIRGWERVVQLTFERAGERGPEVFAIMAELMGRWSNLILVEGAAGTILDAVKLVPGEWKRPVQRGTDYRMPPGQAKPDPDAITEADIRRIWEAAGGSAASLKDQVRALVGGMSGFSPQNAEVLLHRSGGGRRSGAGGPPEIWRAMCGMRDALHRGALSPFLLFDAERKPAGLMAFPPEGAPADAVQRAASFNEAAAVYYQHTDPRRSILTAKTAARHEVARALERAKKLRGMLEEDIRASEKDEEAREKGECLLRHIHEIDPHAALFLAEEEGRRWEIALDPRYSPSENAQRYFRRYKKLKRLRKIAADRQTGNARSLDFLENLLFDVDEAASLEEITLLRDTFDKSGLGSRQRRRKESTRRKRKEPGKILPYRHFTAPEGWQIFVGKNAAGNDALIRKLGRAGDLWLHAKGLPGSHVLLRGPGGREGEAPPDAILELAARLAAHFSRARESGKAAVDCVSFRRLRRPRGAPPGFVIYTGQRTLTVSPADPETLDALLTQEER